MPDVFRVPNDVTYAIQGGVPALLAYRRCRNISRDDLALRAASPNPTSRISRMEMDIEEGMLNCLAAVLKVPLDQLI